MWDEICYVTNNVNIQFKRIEYYEININFKQQMAYRKLNHYIFGTDFWPFVMFTLVMFIGNLMELLFWYISNYRIWIMALTVIGYQYGVPQIKSFMVAVFIDNN